MVFTRSGNRTTRPSPGEPDKSEAPKPTDTPKRRRRPAKNVKKVFDDDESVTSGTTTPSVTPQVSERASVVSEAGSQQSEGREAAGADSEPEFLGEVEQKQPKWISPRKSERVAKMTPSSKKEVSTSSIASVDVFDSDDVVKDSEKKVSPKKSISLKKEDSGDSDDVVEVKISPKKSQISLKKEDSEKKIYPKKSQISLEKEDSGDSDEVVEVKVSPKKSLIPLEKEDSGESGEVVEDSEDDEPMEISFKKPEVPAAPESKDSEFVVKDSDDVEDSEDDDDDEPMEISSKKPEVPAPESKNSESVVKNSDDVEDSDDDDDDVSMEMTSKVVEKPEEPKSVVEKLLEKKAEKSAKIAAKKLKKRNKKKEAKKISEGVFEVKMKKSKAKFNVVTLKSGVQKMLEPEVNFRDELLKARTAGTRCVNTEKYYQRAQWVSRR